MARTDAAAVKALFDADPCSAPVDENLEPFIVAANMLVTRACTGEAGPTPSYSAEELEIIERWLSAHFYAVSSPRATAESADGISKSYQSKIGFGLNLSHYGQMAMRLDTNGGLAAINEETKEGKPRVGITWLGTPPDEVAIT